jgi:hypothetical protein
MSIISGINNIAKMNKSERIKRLIEISVKEEISSIDMNEMMEKVMIQTIRQENGEIDEVLKNRID